MRLSPFLGASELAAAIRSRHILARDVLEMYLGRIAKHNSALNAICTLDEPGARRKADEADSALSRGALWGPLHGVPMTIKDALETAGLRTTGGHPPLKDYIPKRDATVVARLRAAGAVLIGKTNVPPLSADYRADNPIFGRTNNPWDLSRTPSGSTGGGAAAVSAGLSTFDVGSDIAGSVRTPAHYCGLFCITPTDHTVPTTGHIPEVPGMLRAVRHMNLVGPLTRSVEDLGVILRTIAGPDGMRWEIPAIPWTDVPEPQLNTLRFAWCADFSGVPVTDETRRGIAKLANELGRLGCRVEELSPTGFDFEEAWEVWGEIAIAERAATAPDRVKERVDALLETCGDRVAVARGSAKGARAPVAEYLKALSRRDRLIDVLERFFNDWDAFLCPVSVGPAIPHVPFGTPIDVDGKKVPYYLAGTSYTAPFNVTGHPAVVLPLTKSTDGLPIGVQVVGRRWGEPALLALARRLALIAGPFQPPPMFADATST